MRYIKTDETYLVRLETGEEIFAAISDFAAQREISLGSVAGIGAAYDVVLGYYDRAAKEYSRRRVPGEVEITSLVGNIALKDGRPFPHLHATLAGPDFQALAGHFFEGRVGGTLELIVRPLPGSVGRVLDDDVGLFLLNV
jgi:predicted DNA-binding protein with PD1-like motif